MVMAVLVLVVVEVVLVVLRVIVVVWVVVVVVIGVLVVLVVTIDQPHFQQLPYILSKAITLKIESDNDPLNWAILRLAVKQFLPSETRIIFGRGGWGRGGGRDVSLRFIFEAAPVQTVAVTAPSSRSSCRSRTRTVNVKGLLPLSFFSFFFLQM